MSRAAAPAEFSSTATELSPRLQRASRTQKKSYQPSLLIRVFLLAAAALSLLSLLQLGKLPIRAASQAGMGTFALLLTLELLLRRLQGKEAEVTTALASAFIYGTATEYLLQHGEVGTLGALTALFLSTILVLYPNQMAAPTSTSTLLVGLSTIFIVRFAATPLFSLHAPLYPQLLEAVLPAIFCLSVPAQKVVRSGGFIVWLTVALTLFSMILVHEYFYYDPHGRLIPPHQELLGSITLLPLLWIISRLASRSASLQHILLGILLLVVVFLFPRVTLYSFSLPLAQLGGLNLQELAVGLGSGWRAWAQQSPLAISHHTLQFPMPPLLSLLFHGGTIGILLMAVATTIAWCRPQRWSLVVLAPLLLCPGGLSLLPLTLFGTCTKEVSLPRGSVHLAPWCFLLLQAMLASGLLAIGVAVTSKTPRIVNQPNSPLAVNSATVISLLALEDILFFEHYGIDFARLWWVTRDLLEGRASGRGGSTITMQLAKYQYLSFDKSISRKVQQIAAATALEATRSKEQILKEYLSTVSFGVGLYGIEAASRHYYGKGASELHRGEARNLLLVIEDPVHLSPTMRPLPSELLFRKRQMARASAHFADSLLPHIRPLPFVLRDNR